MHVNSSELNQIWLAINADMLNKESRHKLQDHGYTLGLHKSLSALVKAESPFGDPSQLTLILAPLTAYCQEQAQQPAKSAEIVPLHRGIKNEKLQSHLMEQARNFGVTNHIVKKYGDLLTLITFVQNDPRLKQADPALAGHSLDF